MSKLTFPLRDVILEETDTLPEVTPPISKGENWLANNHEFLLQVKDVGSFYVRDGREVRYHAVDGADRDWLQLYLNGQVLVALLHQRKIINFHASSFVYDGRGVMILGETGAGKSSLTLAFTLQHGGPGPDNNSPAVSGAAGFLTDDLTPVIFREGIPFIWHLGRKVKIRENTASQLNIESGRLSDAEAGTGKKYLDLVPAAVVDHKLHIIMKIEIGDVTKVLFHEPSPAEKFSLLRSEICSWEYLAGMPETEEAFLHQLVQILGQVLLVRVVRPVEIPIISLHTIVRDYLEATNGARSSLK